ncbi:MAG: hypothetical protein H0X27_10375 [Caulobacteraceae bacterium]|nr:hypothetical protein [Caulobacteraceae bacterium]
MRAGSRRPKTRLRPALALGALLLSACDGPGAPTAPGVCWRDVAAPGAVRRFVALARDVATLDDCAAQLEAIHLMSGQAVAGAFQGYFIAADARQVSSSASRNGFRYPVFQPSQRREIDADLGALIKDRNGRAPSAGDIAVLRR